MRLLEDDLAGLTGAIWSSVVGREAVPSPAPPPTSPAGALRTVTACVHIAGGWAGSVVVSLPHELAASIAAAMFGVPATELTSAEVRDAVGELANIAGGNVKGLVDEPCELSLPVVAEGSDYVVTQPGTRVATAVTMEQDGVPFCVSIHVRG